MEDSLFPLSPRGEDEQRLGDDSMERAATEVLLATEEDSLFNDSLDDDVHTVGKGQRGTGNEQNMNDSLDFEPTQLPFSDDASSQPQVPSYNSGITSDVLKSTTTLKAAGFQMADNLPITPGELAGGKKATSTSVIEAENTVSEQYQVTTPPAADINDDMESSAGIKVIPDTKSSSPSVVTGNSSTTTDGINPTAQKPSKVVPSFGRKKKNTSPPPKLAKPESKLSDNATHTVPSVENQHKDGGSECVGSMNDSIQRKDKQEDQCVPDTTSKSIKPTTSKNATTTKDKQSTEETEEEIDTDKKAPVNKKEKKSAIREQKKQEREEKKKEAERKKLEREQKKCEAEKKRIEKERLKRDRQFELERKKAEREQKKIERALKKTEPTPSKKHNKNPDKKDTTPNMEHLPSNVAASKMDEDQMQTEATHSEEAAGKEEHLEHDTATENQGLKHDCDVNTAVDGVTPPNESATLPEGRSLPGLPSDSPSTEVVSNSSRVQVADDSQSASMHLQSAEEGGTCDLAEGPVGEEEGLAEGGLVDEETAAGSTDTPDTEANDQKATTEAITPPTREDSGEQTQQEERSSAEDVDGTSISPVQSSKCAVVEVEKLKILFGKSGSKKNIGKPLTAKQNSGNDSATGCPTMTKATKTKHFKAPAKSAPRKLNETSTGRDGKKSLAKSKQARQRKRESGGDNTGSVGGKAKRSKQSNYTGPVWVQCESCEKWRQLEDCTDPLSLPDSWNCSMNTDPERGSCSASEENWDEDVGNSQEYVETPFIPGSLVWSKMDGYPWWPAMVEEDPNEEAYYEMGKSGTSNVPVRFHVVFFDTPVSRAWVTNFHTHPYTVETDYNTTTGASVPQKHKRGLKEARKQANKASTMTIATRLMKFSFTNRFRKTTSRKRKNVDPEGKGRVKLPKLSSLCGGNPARTSSSVTIGGDREGLDVEEECVRGREGVDEVGCEREGGSEGVGDGEEESGDSSRGNMED